MNKNEIMRNLALSANKIKFCAKKHSPEILVATGVIGVVASAVLACRATLKVNSILEDTKTDVDAVHSCTGDEELAEKYTEDDAKKDLTVIYIKTAARIGKLYAPAVALGAASITCILASNDILKKRNVALAAAYATIDKGFKEYRGRVVDRFGDAVDRELRYNIKATEFEETVVDEKTGKEKKKKQTVDISELDTCNDYARFFDELSCHWERDSEYNLMFLRAQQNYANDKLRAQGYLFLNDVYQMLDIPTTKAGQVVGWLYDPDDPNKENYVDFGIYETNREKAREFVNGYEYSILLNFNVDGYILDKCW